MTKPGMILIPADVELEIERVQTGIRMEKRLLKVLRATADYKDMPLGGLLEMIVFYAFGDIPSPFTQTDLERIRQLKNVYYSEDEMRGSPESRLFNYIIRVAIKDGAPEVHLEPQQDGLIHVLYCLDAEMRDQLRLPVQTAWEPLIQHIKALMDPDGTKDKNLQENPLNIQMHDGSKFRFQISIDFTRFGEKAIFHLEPL